MYRYYQLNRLVDIRWMSLVCTVYIPQQAMLIKSAQWQARRTSHPFYIADRRDYQEVISIRRKLYEMLAVIALRMACVDRIFVNPSTGILLQSIT